MRHYSTRHRIQYTLGMFVILIALVLSGIIMYWVNYPYRALEIKSPMPVLNSPVEPGETVQYVVDFCKYTDKPTKISGRIVNDVVIGLPEGTATAKNECGTLVSNTFMVPDILPPGKYRLDFVATIRVNPLREIHVPYETEEFEVIAKGGE